MTKKVYNRLIVRLQDSILRWLAFPPEHRALAWRLARTGAKLGARPGKIGSELRLPIELRAQQLAVAAVRHALTCYDSRPENLGLRNRQCWREECSAQAMKIIKFLRTGEGDCARAENR